MRRFRSSAGIWSRKDRAIIYAVAAVTLGFFVLFGVVPTAANLVISLTDYTALPGAGASFVGLDNYRQLFTTQRPGLFESLEATLYFTVGVTLLQNILGLALAHRLKTISRSATILRFLAFVPIVLGVTVVGIIWLLLFNPAGGPGSNALSSVGIHSAYFGSDKAAIGMVILVQVWQNVGFTMLLFVGSLKSIPVSIYEAASLDGVNAWNRFWRITWPLMAPAVTVSLVLSIIGTLTMSYNLIYVLTGGQQKTNILAMLAFTSAFGQTSNLGLGASVTAMLLIFTALLAIPAALLLRWRERRIFN